jgi:hypothetical protein
MPLGPSHVSKNLSSISKEISRQTCKTNKINIPKIFANWSDIIGHDFHDKCIPFNITWTRNRAKAKNKPGFKKGNADWGASLPTSPSAAKSKPEKTTPEKAKKEFDASATLHILASSAIATRILYQEHLIIERLSRVLGYSAIKRIQIKHESGLDQSGFHYSTPKELSASDRQELDSMLINIEDQGLKNRLKSMGEKILLDQST